MMNAVGNHSSAASHGGISLPGHGLHLRRVSWRVCKECQKKKFDALLSRQTLERQPSDRHVVNLSSRKLNASQRQALSRGLNFAPSPQFIPKVHIVASVEAAIYRSGAIEEQATKACVGVVGPLSCAKLPPRNTLPGEMMAVKQLASDKDIVILPADIGRATVVMNQSDYSAKMQAMLDDRDTYQPFIKGPNQLFGEQDEPHLTKTKTRRTALRQDLRPAAPFCRQGPSPVWTT